LSKGSVPVLIEAVSIEISTRPDLPALSKVMLPAFLSNRPRLVLVPKCSTSKVTKVCVGSMA